MRIVTALLAFAVSIPKGMAGQDTVVVQADNAPVWGSNPSLIEDLGIGVLEGDSNYTFGSVEGVATMPDGSVWVMDGVVGTIRRYGPDGRHLGNVGRKGEGPGEFSNVTGLRLLPEGAVAVWDPLNSRIHKFGIQGDLVEHLRVPVSAQIGGASLQSLEVDTAGNLYVIAMDMPERTSTQINTYWLRLSAGGAVLDTVDRLPVEREGSYQAVVSASALSPLGYRWDARNDEYALHRQLRDGRVVRVERSWKPTNYQRDERDEAQRFEDHYAGRNGRPPRRIPSTKPAWASYEVDAEGRLWIERYAPGVPVTETETQRETRNQFDNPERRWSQFLVYDVIEPAGRYLGTLTFPNSATASGTARVDVMLARGTEVWTVQRGEFDEQYVIRYRVQPGS